MTRTSVVQTRVPYGMQAVPVRITATPAPRLAIHGLSGDPARREVPFGPCLDWGQGEWRDVRSTTADAQARIARAQATHGPRCLSQHVTGHPGVGLDEPIRTITTKDQWIAVDGKRYRPLTERELARGMGFPDSYRWPDVGRVHVVRGLGNAVPPPVARDLVRAVMEAA